MILFQRKEQGELWTELTIDREALTLKRALDTGWLEQFIKQEENGVLPLINYRSGNSPQGKGVCTENLSSGVAVMKSAQDGA
jgi:hypothetical protein